MKNLLASTAVILAMVGPAAAQNATGFIDAPADGDIYATNLIGMRLYVTDQSVTDDMPITQDQLSTDWNDVGEVGDLLVSPEGQVKAVILDVGGFLGMGEHTVAADMSQLHFLHDQNDPGDIFIAMQGTKESLEAAPEFDRGDMVDQAAATAPAAGTTGMAAPATTADTTAAGTAAPAGGMMAGDAWQRPAMQADGYTDVPADQVTADTLTGATVYGPDNQSIGNVDDLIVGSDGKVTDAIIDVGGFLGMGSHRVKVSFDEMQIMQDANGGDVRVNVSATQDQLEARPEYNS